MIKSEKSNSKDKQKTQGCENKIKFKERDGYLQTREYYRLGSNDVMN